MSFQASGLFCGLLLACQLVACNGGEKASSASPSASASSVPAPPIEQLRPAMHLLAIGEPVPKFSVLAHTGMLVQPERFFPKPVAVFFCPALANAACTTALFALRDGWLKLRPHISMVVALLGEDRLTLREYAYAQELPFLLGSDGEQVLGRAFGVGLDGSSAAQLFLIEPGMKVAGRFADPGGQVVQRLLDVLPQQ